MLYHYEISYFSNSFNLIIITPYFLEEMNTTILCSVITVIVIFNSRYLNMEVVYI